MTGIWVYFWEFIKVNDAELFQDSVDDICEHEAYVYKGEFMITSLQVSGFKG